MSSIARFWDRVAKRFAAAEIKDVQSYQRRLKAIEAALGPDARVLDMACGSGMLAVQLAPLVANIDAVDISPKMLHIAGERASSLCNVHFQLGSIEDFTAPPASYDAVLAMSVLHLLDDWRGAIAKAHDLLKPGGVFISNTHCIEGERKRLKFVVRVGVPLGIMPNLQVFGKEAFLAAIRDAGFLIEEEWQKEAKKPVFVVARKPG